MTLKTSNCNNYNNDNNKSKNSNNDNSCNNNTDNDNDNDKNNQKLKCIPYLNRTLKIGQRVIICKFLKRSSSNTPD